MYVQVCVTLDKGFLISNQSENTGHILYNKHQMYTLYH